MLRDKQYFFRLNYSQEYIEHGYKELAMLPKNGEAGLSLFRIFVVHVAWRSSYYNFRFSVCHGSRRTSHLAKTNFHVDSLAKPGEIKL